MVQSLISSLNLSINPETDHSMKHLNPKTHSHTGWTKFTHTHSCIVHPHTLMHSSHAHTHTHTPTHFPHTHTHTHSCIVHTLTLMHSSPTHTHTPTHFPTRAHTDCTRNCGVFEPYIKCPVNM